MLDQALGRIGGTRQPVAVLCLDLDRFKSVNDTFGPPVDYALLRALGETPPLVTGTG